MSSIMNFGEYKAVIQYDADIESFRGEFIGLNGGADFYADSIEALRKEGEISLKVFLAMCKEEGIAPKKLYSGKFNVRIPPELHEKAAQHAAASNVSLNHLVSEALRAQL